jgi:hypothetical protein
VAIDQRPPRKLAWRECTELAEVVGVVEARAGTANGTGANAAMLFTKGQ